MLKRDRTLFFTIGWLGSIVFSASFARAQIGERHAPDQVPPGSDKPKEVVLERKIGFQGPIRLTSKVPGYWLSEIDLGDVPAARSLAVSMLLRNDTDQDWKFSGGQTSCGCAVAEFEDDEWGSGENGMVRLRLETPTRLSSDVFGVRVLFKGKTGDQPELPVQLILTIKMRLIGIADFKQRVNELPFEESAEKYYVPIRCHCPASDVVVEHSNPELVTETEIVGDGSDAALAITIDGAVLPDDGASISVLLKNKITQLGSSALLMLERPGALSISPRTLRFFRDDADQSGRFVASAVMLVRSRKNLDAGENPSSNKSSQAKSVMFRATLPSGDELPVSFTRVGSRGYKIQVSATETQLSQAVSERELKWRVFHDSRWHEITSNIVFDLKKILPGRD